MRIPIATEVGEGGRIRIRRRGVHDAGVRHGEARAAAQLGGALTLTHVVIPGVPIRLGRSAAPIGPILPCERFPCADPSRHTDWRPPWNVRIFGRRSAVEYNRASNAEGNAAPRNMTRTEIDLLEVSSQFECCDAAKPVHIAASQSFRRDCGVVLALRIVVGCGIA